MASYWNAKSREVLESQSRGETRDPIMTRPGEHTAKHMAQSLVRRLAGKASENNQRPGAQQSLWLQEPELS